jgi:TP901-1 family phage major tail protein
MVAILGRTITVYWGDESPQPAVAGIREKGVTGSGEPVDQTNDDSDGWRALIDAAQVNTVDFSASGVLLNDTLRADWFAGASAEGRRMQAATFEYPDGGTISGTFYLSEYAETGNHDGEVTFEATWNNSGAVTYTPAA